jgi:hypothetical protein
MTFLIGDPDMGFSSLRTFGPSLIHHTQVFNFIINMIQAFIMNLVKGP